MKIFIDLNHEDLRAAVTDWLQKHKKGLVDGMNVGISFAGAANEVEARVTITERPPIGGVRD